MPIISKTAKLIAALILIATISLSAFCVWFSWSGLIPLIASIGGEIVFLGLWIEKEADDGVKKEEHLSSELKLKAKIGWWLLMAGILMEVAFGAGLAAYDVYENAKTTNAIAEADTRNLPIQSIKGYARVEVRPKGDRETQFAMNLHQISPNSEPQFSDVEMNKGEVAILYFGKSPKNEPENGVAEIGVVAHVVFVGTVLGQGVAVRKSMPYVPNICFDLTFDSQKQQGIWNPNNVTFSELKYVRIEGLGKEMVAAPLETIGGKITIFAGEWPKNFLIPPQTNLFWRVSSFETNNEFVSAGYGNLTNSQSEK